ncbi:hypothetical protein G9P44_003784 [Scheffersomyces stipitis]|nr:hypothetical protein G9P44_003784 [Scheffersomyces stipitis]
MTSANSDISNSDFDINILDDAFETPDIELTFPLPTDKETYIDIEGNEKASKSIGILFSAFKLFSGIPVEKVYSNNEYRYFTNKHSAAFKKKFEDYMNDKLEKSDKKLDELIYTLINQELNLKLITPADFNHRFKEVKKFMVAYYKKENEKNLPTFHSHNFVRTAYITVIMVLRKMFPRGIWVSRQDFSELYRKYLEDPMSIIFLPSHQSHVDYIILHVLCVRFQMAIPTVVAGENLNVAVFGKFMRNLGAIFIKRSFNNELYTERNLNNVIEFMLVNKINFEVFIEGTRSRDGKLLLPKYGILKTLTSIYLKQRYLENNSNFDLLFQPVSVRYERIYETDGYLKELTGSDKKQESMLNIVQNGVGNLLGAETADPVVWGKDGFNDNSERNLNGKIFFKLGNSFRLSSFVESDREFLNEVTATIKSNPSASLETEHSKVNLKRLGFKILHEVNRISYLPEIAIIGTALQVHYYFFKKDVFDVYEVIPILKLVAETLYNENLDSPTNSKILHDLLSLSDEDMAVLIKTQIIDFLRLVRVNERKNLIKIENPIELLYYKNLSIHLIIQRCLISFILLLLEGLGQSNYRVISKVFYIVTGFLKNEFLFDYNYNERNELSFILKDFVQSGVIAVETNDKGEEFYKVIDVKYLQLFGDLATPFLESYLVLIDHIFELNERLARHYKKNKAAIQKDAIIDEDELKYPDTKSLLKYITSQSRKHPERVGSLESINKQYLLSDIYYLANLQVIQIFKNKAKTKAFVKITNGRDLNILHDFLSQILGKKSEKTLLTDEININYVIDIVDKRDDRDVNQLRLGTSKL